MINSTNVRDESLPAPTVREATNNHIDADSPFATVDIKPYTGMAAGDRVDLQWNADKTKLYTDYLPVSVATVGHTLSFQVPAEQIAGNTRAAVSYMVTPVTGKQQDSLVLALTIGESALLPALSIDEVKGNTIDPANNPQGVTVRVPATAKLAAGDMVTISWAGKPGEGTTEVEQTVSSAQAGQSLPVHISPGVVQANEGSSVRVSYRVDRAAGEMENSVATVYNVVTCKLKVMGARTQYGCVCRSSDRMLAALNTDTLKLQQAVWQYEGEEESVTGSRFRDTKPAKLWHVRSSDEHVVLNVSNITGSDGAAVVRQDDKHVVAWGGRQYGGSLPPDIASLDDIVAVTANICAFAALRKTGQVVAWGGNRGEVSADIAARNDIAAVIGSKDAFAVLLTNGQVMAWGSSNYGGSVPSDIASLKDIVAVSAGGCAFAALRASGKIVTWGYASYGGTMPSEIAALDNIVTVAGNTGAFVALLDTGHVVAWGKSGSGGKLPDDIAALNNIVAVTESGFGPNSKNAFAALCADGRMVVWGDSDYGGVPGPAVAPLQGNIRAVYGCPPGFIALTANSQSGNCGAYLDGMPSFVNGTVSYEVIPVSRGPGITSR